VFWNLKEGYGIVLTDDICIGNDGGKSVDDLHYLQVNAPCLS
jgi:hypothetical protein